MASSLVAALRGGGAAEREAVYAELLRREEEAEHSSGASAAAVGTQLPAAGSSADTSPAEHFAEIAVACASPLCEVLCKNAAEVSAEEWRRAAQVLTALCGVEPARVGGQCYSAGQCTLCAAWVAPESALGVLLAKEPAALTPEDALTVGCAVAPVPVMWATPNALDANCRAVGISPNDFLALHMPASFLMPFATPTDDRNLALVPLLLELLKAPETLPQFALGRSGPSAAPASVLRDAHWSERAVTRTCVPVVALQLGCSWRSAKV